MRQKKIGNFEEYTAADERYTELQNQNREPEFEMDATSLEYARLVRRWDAVSIGFPILWVKGNYEKAEESFIKINKTGRRLSDWETKLVENRSSSFARTVMSIAQISDAEHCWPIRDLEVKKNEELQRKITLILEKVRSLHELLFTPVYETPIRDPRQPLLATPYTKPEIKPAYLAELLTIVEGKKGQKPETEKLIKKDRLASTRQIINNGLQLIEDATGILSNIYGNSPRSLALMPLVYFYNIQGIFVRSLLYGLLYWLNEGSENRDVLHRKLLFSIHRAAFEEVLLQKKDIIIRRIGRRIGSGPEVTYPTARYYQGLLKLLIQHNDNVESQEFQTAHERLIETLDKDKSDEVDQDLESLSRTYRGRMRTSVHVQDFLQMFKHCEICGGRYYPGLFTEVDHIRPHAQGGKTTLRNARNSHPFCNNNRDTIEEIRNGKMYIELPPFGDQENLPKMEQLSFLQIFDDTVDDLVEETEEEEEENEEQD
jgi:5-methylcytosine-specific restriction endonuclease McrA